MSRIVTAVTWRNVSVRRLRRRKAETVQLRLDVPCELAEVSRDELTVAARVRDPKGEHLLFHTYRGRFVRPTERSVAADRAADYFAGTMEGGRRPPTFGLVSAPEAAAVLRARDLPFDPDAGVREILSDPAEARAAEVRDEVGGYLLVDGTLWEPSPEPFWSVRRAVPGDVISVAVAARAPGEPPPGAGQGTSVEEIATFRLDRGACADRYARAAAHRRRRRYQDLVPEVLCGVAFSRDDRQEAALALGRRVVALLPDGWLRLLPGSAIVEWCRLRDETAERAVDADAVARRSLALVAAVEALELNANGLADRAKLNRRLADASARFLEHEDPLPSSALEASEDRALAALGGGA